MSRTGHKYTAAEITTLRFSKRWKQRYSKFLPKDLVGASVTNQGLWEWFGEVVLFIKEHKILLTSERALKKQIELAEPLLRVIQDPPGIEMYHEIPPGPKSTHKLPTFISKRPESKLERFHGDMEHFGNTAMRPELTDILTLRGMAERNVVIRWQLLCKKVTTLMCFLPAHLRDIPPHMNHSLLHHLDTMARQKGLEPMFENDIRDLPPNNGEKFLSKYFVEQLHRNGRGFTNRNERCGCGECKANLIPLTHAVQAEALLEDEAAMVPDQLVRETIEINLDTGQSETLTIVSTKAFITVGQPIARAHPLPEIPIAPPLIQPAQQSHWLSISLLTSFPQKPGTLASAQPSFQNFTAGNALFPPNFICHPNFGLGTLPATRSLPFVATIMTKGLLGHAGCCERKTLYDMHWQRTGKKKAG